MPDTWEDAECEDVCGCGDCYPVIVHFENESQRENMHEAFKQIQERRLF